MKARAFTRAQRTAWAPERHTSGKEVSRGPPAEPPICSPTRLEWQKIHRRLACRLPFL